MPSSTLTPSPVPPTALYNTSVAPHVRATLPPTWTLTPTLIPSHTYTPSAIPSPTSTRSLDDLCDTLQVNFPYEEGHTFSPDATLLIFFGTTERLWDSQIQAATPDMVEGLPIATRPPALLTQPVQVRFLAVHRETGENLGAEVYGGELMAMELPISQLPLPGLYDWSVSIYLHTLGEQCAHTGTFVVGEETNEP